jgi:enoyl-CoA hydratase
VTSPAVRLERRDDGVARLIIDRPQVHNALDRPAMELLGDVLEQLADDASVRCVVLTGSGRAFCAGADLAAGRAEDLDDAPGGGAEQMLAAVGRVITLLTTLPIPVIAALRGPAAGVGASLALAADLVVASEDAYFLFPFTGIGLLPDGGATLTLATAVGRTRAMRLVLRRERFPAQEAFNAGLVAAVCPAEELEATAEAWAVELAAGARLALARTKAAVNAATLSGLRHALGRETVDQVRLLAAADFREGVASFLERRTPAFRD